MNNYLKIVLTGAITLGLILVFSFFIEKGQKRYHVHKYHRIQEIYNSAAVYDILFLGSSRTHGGIFPKIIDSVTGLKSYNGGVEGGNLYEIKLTFDGYLVHHPSPRLVVLNIDPTSFDVDRKMFFPMQYFESLDNPVLEAAFKTNEEYRFWIIKYLPFMRLIYYDDYTKSLALKGLGGKNEIQASGGIEYKGFLSQGNRVWDTSAAKTLLPVRLKIQKEGINHLLAILDTCRKKKVQIIFTYAPEFNFTWQRTFVNFTDCIKPMQAINRQYQIAFFRDDSLRLCQNVHFFMNHAHLNTSGAVEYSKILGKRIVDVLKR